MTRVVLALAVVLAACGGTPEEPAADPAVEAAGAASPEAAVTSVMRGIDDADGALLEAMTVTDQLPLVALVEGATPVEAAAALGFASEQVASQFWQSFANGIEDFLGAAVADIRIGEVRTIDVPGARYAGVEVMFPLDNAERSFVVTDRNGWQVDLIATFPGAFLPNIDSALDRASSPSADPEVAASIRSQIDSLDALEAIGVPPELADAYASARAAITDAG